MPGFGKLKITGLGGRRLEKYCTLDHEVTSIRIWLPSSPNCLMGDLDQDKVAALLSAVAKMGAEYFVIDAGWYADDSTSWDEACGSLRKEILTF
ncbi:Aldolase-type TIM barrel [Penicillium robsamsonii]|uniref:Aldolase-type TIM barrel n=1 Tax=Penicillium robsamsonii TaxID=1792511 RepID=UPI0025477A5A|nr:Aldolase-type TIM barrel [Penicillium robsamsonii]KAJ5827312.1 Aldolase-type TIM barrel [Penicillium robsamsonii]